MLSPDISEKCSNQQFADKHRQHQGFFITSPSAGQRKAGLGSVATLFSTPAKG
jgi:hypothetical protein